MPFLAAIVAGGALAVILSTQSFSLALPAISLPTVAIPSVSLPALPEITNPFTSVQLPQMSMPQISLLPLQLVIISFFQNITLLFSSFLQGLLALILFLNPFPALITFGKQVIALENTLLQLTIMNTLDVFITVYKLQILIYTFANYLIDQALINMFSFTQMCIQTLIAGGSFFTNDFYESYRSNCSLRERNG